LTQPLTALLKQRSEHKNSNICQFFIDFKGVEWRAQQLQYQMPTHDIQMFKLQTNEVKFVRNQQRRAQIKPQLFLNKSLNYCFKCKQCIENGSYGVKISVPKSGNQNIGYQTTGEDEDNNVLKVNTTDTSQPPLNGSTALYHIQCFICEECQEVLVDLKAFLYTNSDPNDRLKLTNSLYCSRHFVELFKPRCQSCDHLIFDEECTEAEGKAWHLGHFACNECKRSLGGQQYIMADPSKQNDKKSIYGTKSQVSNNNRPPKLLPYCLTCFDILFGELCEECGELIGCDVGAISHEGRSWHAIDQCFKCNLCSKALLGKPFLPALDGRIYCSISCSQEAVQRQRHRPRKQKHIQTTPSNCINTQSNSNNNLLIKSNNCSEDLIRYQTKSKTSITQMRPNESTHKISQEANCKLPFNENLYNKLTVKEIPTNSDFNSCQPSDELNEFNLKLGEIKLSETKSYGSENSQPNDFVISIDDQKVNQSVNQSVNFDQNFMADNNQMNQQLFEYIQRCQNSTKTPNHFLMEYMKQQLLHNDINGHNGIIGATIECGSSLSEDERTNQHTVDHKVMYNTNVNYNPMTSKTSSESSSLNVTHFDINNTHINGENIIKYNPSITHSSSSNETTPLLLRPLPEKNKSIIQLQNISKPSLNKISMFSQHSLPHRESPSQTSQTSQTSHTTQTSQADQSSNSSFIENSNQTNTSNTHEVMADIRNTVDVNTPSTQSTALQSTSSQTTPETTARTGNKSVTFDPSVKETTGKRISRKPRSRSTHRKSEWTDSHSCSTCSTCSSSSSSSDYDDDFDYQSTLERNRNQWLGGTKIQYVSNDRKKNVTNNVVNGDQNPHNSESCTIA
ncbi:GATA zinc finger domain-containing protein 14-like, partial [Oppia nitens]|uniref:GATA zinc finger domain-containing protein 14-like n=1 Tax=Oppia nitens TaxID=1686743 RepID=UPI0023D988BD